MRIAAITIGCWWLLASCVNNGNSEHQGLNDGLASNNIQRDYYTEVEAYNAPQGVDAKLISELKETLLNELADAGKLRGISAATMDSRSQAFLAFNEGSQELEWGLYSTGDYDQNGEVNVADITPIAIHFGVSGEFEADSLEAVIDGDQNGEINLGDITPIAINFSASTTGFNVYTSPSESDYPVLPGDPNGAGTVLVGTMSMAGEIPSDSRRSLSYGLVQPEDGYYWVRPTDGAENGTASTVLELLFTPNILPVADLLADRVKGDVPMEVSFDARGSTDEDGIIVKFEFDWDGAENGEEWVDQGTDGTVVHNYPDIGMFDTTVRVTDDRGGFSTASILISASQVGNDDPVADIQATPDLGDLPLEVEFDASASFDVDSEIVLYEWDLDGDSTFELDTGSEPIVTQTFYSNRLYECSVRVTDFEGASTTALVEVTVSGTPEDWAMFGRGVRRTSLSSFVGPQFNSPKWSYQTSGPVTSSPAIGIDGTVYVGSEAGYLYAIAPDGTLKWRYTLGEAVLSSPALDQSGHIYIGCLNGLFHAIDADGGLIWNYQTGGQIQGNALVTQDDRVYVGSGDGDLYCFNTSGNVLWKYETNGAFFSSPALDDDGNVIVGHSSGKVLAINPLGNEEWFYQTGDYISSSPAIASDGTIYIGSDDDNLYALNSDGSLYWQYPTLGHVFSSPAIGPQGDVYVGSLSGNFYSLTPEGDLNWEILFPAAIWSSPAVGSNGTVYIGCNDSRMYAINPAGTVLWNYLAVNLFQSSPAISRDGTLYIGSEDRRLHAIGGM